MEVNLAYLYDILSYMIEAQYYDNCEPNDYLDFIQHYKESVESQGSIDKRDSFQYGLKQVMKGILNHPELNYDEIFLNGAMHGLGSQDKARRVLEMIWTTFFGKENWNDSQFSGADVFFVDKPFEG